MNQYTQEELWVICKLRLDWRFRLKMANHLFCAKDGWIETQLTCTVPLLRYNRFIERDGYLSRLVSA